MINDYSEVMSTIHKDINKLQDYLDRKKHLEATGSIILIIKQLNEVLDYIDRIVNHE